MVVRLAIDSITGVAGYILRHRIFTSITTPAFIGGLLRWCGLRIFRVALFLLLKSLQGRRRRSPNGLVKAQRRLHGVPTFYLCSARCGAKLPYRSGRDQPSLAK